MTEQTKGWTPERRAAQRELMLKLKPWEKSTGPKTSLGKKKSSGNALKTGIRSAPMQKLKQCLRDIRHKLEAVKGGRLR